ncbi:hypothetical protein Goari_012949, partial [Gossypium aridum]|nr:hypothetical protein [Gossypium aridum]
AKSALLSILAKKVTTVAWDGEKWWRDRIGGDEISLLAEEFTQLSVKSSMVEPTKKPTLLCTIWTEKSYNLDSFRVQIEPCLPEFDKKDLLYAIGVTFGGIIRYEINGDFCRHRIQLDVQKPLRRGIFVLIDNQRKSWISFKYEKLLTFYFGCGRMRHGLKECTGLTHAEKNKIRDDPPYFLALKAELNLIGKESLKFSALSKKMMPQCLYIDDTEKLHEMNTQQKDESTMVQRLKDNLQSIGIEKATKIQEEGSVMEKNEMLNKETVY